MHRLELAAEALCRRAIAIAPSYGHAHSLLAWVLLRRADWSGDVVSFFAEAEAEARTALDTRQAGPVGASNLWVGPLPPAPPR
jgi:hypothetical protein